MESVKEYNLGQLIKNTRLGGNYNTTLIPNQNPLIKMGNLDRGKIRINKLEYIKSQDINENDILKYGDVLFNTRNTPELVGKIAIWKNELKKAYYNSNLMLLKFNSKYIADNFYMNYLFNTKNFIKKTNSIAIGTTSVAAIYNRDLMKLTVKIVPKKEQKKIANILTNIDNLIDSLQKTIKKKEKIRNQAMMVLFNGKNEDLKTISLSQIGCTYNGLSGMISSNFDGGSKRYITFLNILNNPIVKEELFGKFHCNNIQNKVQKGDLFFNTSSETPEEVAMCSTIDYDVSDTYLNSFCFGFRITDKSIDNKYLSYFFRSKYGRNIVKAIAQGSTRFNLPKEKFLNYEIKIHSDIDRQIEISVILLNMDKEIEKLNTKLNKYIKIKEGMMEDLLTGKVRLNYE